MLKETVSQDVRRVMKNGASINGDGCLKIIVIVKQQKERIKQNEKCFSGKVTNLLRTYLGLKIY